MSRTAQLSTNDGECESADQAQQSSLCRQTVKIVILVSETHGPSALIGQQHRVRIGTEVARVDIDRQESVTTRTMIAELYHKTICLQYLSASSQSISRNDRQRVDEHHIWKSNSRQTRHGQYHCCSLGAATYSQVHAHGRW